MASPFSDSDSPCGLFEAKAASVAPPDRTFFAVVGVAEKLVEFGVDMFSIVSKGLQYSKPLSELIELFYQLVGRGRERMKPT